MRAIAQIVCFSFIGVAAHAQLIPGCVTPVGFERAQPPRPSALRDAPLPGPRIWIESLRRGFNDGDSSSCSSAGVLTLVIDSRDVGPTDLYAFEVASGALPDGLLPDGTIESVDLGADQQGFRFYWLDLFPGADELSPLNAVVRINRSTYAGVPSMPMVLDVVDPGGAPETTSSLWNSTSIWVGVTIILLAFVSVRMKAFRRPSRRRDDLAAIQERLRALADEKRAEEKRTDS